MHIHKAKSLVKLFVVPDTQSVIHTLSAVIDSIQPVKISLRKSYFEKETARIGIPEVKSGVACSKDKLMLFTMNAIRSWARSRSVPVGDEEVLLSILGSICKASSADATLLDSIPIDETTANAFLTLFRKDQPTLKRADSNSGLMDGEKICFDNQVMLSSATLHDKEFVTPFDNANIPMYQRSINAPSMRLFSESPATYTQHNKDFFENNALDPNLTRIYPNYELDARQDWTYAHESLRKIQKLSPHNPRNNEEETFQTVKENAIPSYLSCPRVRDQKGVPLPSSRKQFLQKPSAFNMYDGTRFRQPSNQFRR